jgi:mono/diheme cytochrome c family protein
LLADETFDDPLMLEEFARAAWKGYLLAWNPREQKVAWRVEHMTVGGGGVLATAGGLVFQGLEGESVLAAFDAADGKRLWTYPTQEVPAAPAVSYKLHGEQYIAVGVGRGGEIGVLPRLDEAALPPNGRFMAFKLGANTKLPEPTIKVSYGDPPPPTTRDAQVLRQGELLYRAHCLRCHSAKGRSNRRITDLRRMPRALYDSFDAIVRDGAAETAGMPGFGHLLSKKDVSALKAYVLVEAERDQKVRAQPAWWITLQRRFWSLLANLLVHFI